MDISHKDTKSSKKIICESETIIYDEHHNGFTELLHKFVLQLNFNKCSIADLLIND